MVDMYLLGDMLDDIKLRNKVLAALTSYVVLDRIQPGAQEISVFWDRTTPNSPLRKWTVDVTIMRFNRKLFQDDIADYPAEFVQLLAVELMQQIPPTGSKAFQAKVRGYVEVEKDV